MRSSHVTDVTFTLSDLEKVKGPLKDKRTFVTLNSQTALHCMYKS